MPGESGVLRQAEIGLGRLGRGVSGASPTRAEPLARQRCSTGSSPATHEAISQAVHYSIGIAPAVAYALFRDKLPGAGVVRGAVFGLGLFAAQDEVFNTVTGLGASPQRYPWQAHARGLVAHTMYGMATELALTAAEQGLRHWQASGTAPARVTDPVA